MIYVNLETSQGDDPEPFVGERINIEKLLILPLCASANVVRVVVLATKNLV